MKYPALLVLLFTPALLLAKNKVPPAAPLPAQITQAKTVFLVNGGGSDLGFDTFYQEMKTWGKYQLAPSPEQADLVITFEYTTQKNGSSVYSTHNNYTGGEDIHSDENVQHWVRVTITDPKTKSLLWSSTEERKLVLRWNVNKEIEKTAVKVVDNMKARSQ